MTDRVVGAFFFATAVALWIAAGGVVVGFGDQIGPSLFPRMVAVPMGLFALYLVFRPDADPNWPSLGRFGRQAILVVTLLVYPLGLEPLGFPISTFLATAVLGSVMGARPLPSAVSAALIAVGLYVLFDVLLGLPLPLVPTFRF
ncbi:tripartite tricarboxylate transporter TctB family protein [Marinivivus vitaminiproducens]|uniref:tripartite tricarboxylate transporter TctB family protein n=1 Tax=Marinivivus vitaminiproducens TaxID=3035935 RepID=UPI0027A5DACB|nr:tripartite tricarboxylate transporter TctB family protein [Geminicoccaceae bacterium SCSIO 64248]